MKIYTIIVTEYNTQYAYNPILTKHEIIAKTENIARIRARARTPFQNAGVTWVQKVKIVGAEDYK